MSVGAYVKNPEDSFVGGLYTPIAGEMVFENVWVPAIEALNLKYVRYFSLGIDVTKENLQDIKDELYLVKEWVESHLGKEEREFITRRISNLETMLDKAFELDEAVVYIG